MHTNPISSLSRLFSVGVRKRTKFSSAFWGRLSAAWGAALVRPELEERPNHTKQIRQYKFNLRRVSISLECGGLPPLLRLQQSPPNAIPLPSSIPAQSPRPGSQATWECGGLPPLLRLQQSPPNPNSSARAAILSSRPKCRASTELAPTVIPTEATRFSLARRSVVRRVAQWRDLLLRLVLTGAPVAGLPRAH
jgi:hypothetical protein